MTSESFEHFALLQQLLENQQTMQKTIDNMANNVLVLYRRTTALALMLETMSKQEGMRMPKVIRAEIDATLHPEEFRELADKDPEEFRHQYGDTTYKILLKQGVDAICRLQDITQTTKKEKLQ